MNASDFYGAENFDNFLFQTELPVEEFVFETT